MTAGNGKCQVHSMYTSETGYMVIFIFSFLNFHIFPSSLQYAQFTSHSIG